MASERYPRPAKLKDGTTVTLRLMTPDDGAAIRAFAAKLAPDDLLFLRMDITSKAGVEEWIANLKKGNNLSILAFDGANLAGYASVNRNSAGWTRRVGEIRINIAPDRRGTGLGGILTSEVFDLGRSAGLRKLTAQMTPDQAGARAVFEHLGFQPEALLADWVEDRNGRTRDLLVMSYDLDGFTDRIDAPLKS